MNKIEEIKLIIPNNRTGPITLNEYVTLYSLINENKSQIQTGVVKNINVNREKVPIQSINANHINSFAARIVFLSEIYRSTFNPDIKRRATAQDSIVFDNGLDMSTPIGHENVSKVLVMLAISVPRNDSTLLKNICSTKIVTIAIYK
jgi:hypothetical protein